jgi:hypothetical protein
MERTSGESGIEPLVSIAELKTTFLEKIYRGEIEPKLSVTQDSLFGETIVLLVPSENETVVHYVGDGHVALLYLPDSLEIVGFQLEDL